MFSRFTHLWYKSILGLWPAKLIHSYSHILVFLPTVIQFHGHNTISNGKYLIQVSIFKHSMPVILCLFNIGWFELLYLFSHFSHFCPFVNQGQSLCWLGYRISLIYFIFSETHQGHNRPHNKSVWRGELIYCLCAHSGAHTATQIKVRACVGWHTGYHWPIPFFLRLIRIILYLITSQFDMVSLFTVCVHILVLTQPPKWKSEHVLVGILGTTDLFPFFWDSSGS
jgi:hypothetical protein